MRIFHAPLIKRHRLKYLFTPSHFIGLGVFILSFLLCFIDIRLVPIPLATFIFLCMIMPFYPKIGFFLPVVHKGYSGIKGVALTFDDGPDPATTPLLLDVLSENNVKATFFVIGQKADMYPELIQNILSGGHAIGNHTYTHDTFIMLKSAHQIQKEVEAAQICLTKQGIIPLAFRPPVGITNPKLYKLLDINGLYCVNYSRRACDAGNRRITNLSQKILKRIKSNDIVMLHDTPPKNDYEIDQWLNEVKKLLTGISVKGLSVRSLSEIIGRPVMRVAPKTVPSQEKQK